MIKGSLGAKLLYSFDHQHPFVNPLDPLVLCYMSSHHQETFPHGCVLGRGSYNISSEEKISREHCRIVSRPTGYFIIDISRFGTFLYIEPSTGLYLKSKMEIIIDQNAFLVYVKRKNILELVSKEDFGTHQKIVVDRQKNLYLSFQNNKIIENAKETEDSLVFLTRDDGGEIVMKPLDPEM